MSGDDGRVEMLIHGRGQGVYSSDVGGGQPSSQWTMCHAGPGPFLDGYRKSFLQSALQYVGLHSIAPER